MEKIVLAQLDIDTDKVTKETVTLTKDLFKLKKEQSDLNKTTQKAGTINDEQAKRLVALKGRIKENTATLSTNAKVLAEATKAGSANLNTIAGMRAANARYRKEADKTNLTTVAGKARLKELNTAIEANEKTIKSSVDTQRQQTLGVGGYQTAIEGALGKMGPFGQTLVATKNSLVKQKEALLGVAAASKVQAAATGLGTKAFRLFKIALIGTGIGALVVAIGSLVAYFASTQAGINLVTRAIAPLKEAFNTLLGAAQLLGEGLVSMFSGGEDAAEKFKAAADKASEAFGEALERGKRIANLQISLGEGEAKYITALAETRRELKKQNEIVDDITKTYDVRVDAAQRSIDAAQRELEVFQERNKKEVELIQTKQLANDTDDKEKAALATKLAELIEKETTFYKKVTTQRVKLNSLEAAQSKQFASTAAAVEKDRLSALTLRAEKIRAIGEQELAIASRRANSFQQALKAESKYTKGLERVLALEKRGGLKNSKEVAKEKEAILSSSVTRQFKIITSYLSREIEIERFKIQEKIRIAGEGTAEAEAIERASLEKQEALAVTALNERARIGELYGKDEQLARLKLEEEYYLKRTALDKQYIAERQAAEAAAARDTALLQQLTQENAALAATDTLRNSFTQQLADIEAEAVTRTAFFQSQREKELVSEEVYSQAILNINYKKALAQQKIERAANNIKLQGAAAVAGGLSQIAGQESVLGKASAIAQATISTFLGANQALTIPPPLGPILAGVVIASGLANVASIVGVELPTGLAAGLQTTAGGLGQLQQGQIPRPKAERGGLFTAGGRRHSEGGNVFTSPTGETFEMERGEVFGVMSRDASKHFMAFNDLFTSKSQAKPRHFAGGGIVPAGGKVIDYEKMGEAFATGVRSVPNPIVLVEDISDGLDRRTEVRQDAER